MSIDLARYPYLMTVCATHLERTGVCAEHDAAAILLRTLANDMINNHGIKPCPEPVPVHGQTTKD